MRHLYIWICLVIFLLPAFAQARAEKVLDVQEITTESGIEIWLVEDHAVPIVSMAYAFPGGLAMEKMDQPGVASLVSILLDEGAGELNSQAFQKQLADHSISLSFTAGRDYFHGGLKTLTRNLDPAAKLLALALTKPRFDEDAVARMKRSTEATIRQNMNSPGWIAARSFNGLMFEGDPYALPGQGTLGSLARITIDDLKGFAHNQFVKDGMTVAIAGDMTAEQAKDFVGDIFGALPEKGDYKAPETMAKLKNLGHSYVYVFDNPQTHIIAGHQGMAVTDEDWPAAQLVNYVLGGGGFDSRLMEELREKRGLTYGISSYLSDMKRAPMIQTSLSVSNEKAAEAVDLLKREWARMATTGPSERELENAKAYLTGSLVLALTSTDSIAGVLNGLQQNGFDADYINRRNAGLKAVTADQARVVAGRLLDADQLMIMAVGRPVDYTGADILIDIPGLNPPPKGD